LTTLWRLSSCVCAAVAGVDLLTLATGATHHTIQMTKDGVPVAILDMDVEMNEVSQAVLMHANVECDVQRLRVRSASLVLSYPHRISDDDGTVETRTMPGVQLGADVRVQLPVVRALACD
jgi:hypothetical protein